MSGQRIREEDEAAQADEAESPKAAAPTPRTPRPGTASMPSRATRGGQVAGPRAPSAQKPRPPGRAASPPPPGTRSTAQSLKAKAPPPPAPEAAKPPAPKTSSQLLTASNRHPVEDPVVAPFQVGDVIAGKYQVIELIGAGAMGYVVAARHVELGEKFALKFLRAESLANPEIVARFAREARAAVAIKSEHVARVFDIGTLPDGAPFIVMEYLAGRNLGDVLHEQGPLPAKVAVEYVMQVCEALAAAHTNGIVHRDIKPENLFLAEQSQGISIVKVLDFGISKVALTGTAVDTKMPLIRTMLPVGSPVFMSPEQIRSANDVDARTDIWSLGCVLYELLSGTAAFDAPTLTQLTAAILERNPPSLRSLQPDVPPGLEAVVSRCLEKQASQRYQNVGELALALYPFAPRRARISVERCSSVLKREQMPSADFSLSTRPPPPSPKPSNPPESTSAVSVGSPLGQSAASIKRSTQGSISWTELPSSKSSHSWSRALLLGAAVAVAVGGYAVSRRSEPSAASTSSPAATLDESGPNGARTRAHADSLAVRADGTVTAAPSASADQAQAAARSEAKAEAPGRTKSAAAAAKSHAASQPHAAATAASAASKAEPDPGF